MVVRSLVAMGVQATRYNAKRKHFYSKRSEISKVSCLPRVSRNSIMNAYLVDRKRHISEVLEAQVCLSGDMVGASSYAVIVLSQSCSVVPPIVFASAISPFAQRSECARGSSPMRGRLPLSELQIYSLALVAI